ncbi:hypothetical protein [Helcobacillus massiliensis]|uniref:Uncharacterized protein n=1 Tax=Helcobacillus massiliensis TaxID=521392 RepID=A0A839QUC9_9MICO|nr:hypothetical protein [Helcobacillus massiliensis]MBB3023682.1 hypothetical protein [Helcobacillus massiliensis]
MSNPPQPPQGGSHAAGGSANGVPPSQPSAPEQSWGQYPSAAPAPQGQHPSAAPAPEGHAAQAQPPHPAHPGQPAQQQAQPGQPMQGGQQLAPQGQQAQPQAGQQFHGQQHSEPTAEQMKAHLSGQMERFGISNPLPAILAALATYGAGLVAAIITLVSLVIAGAIGASGSSSTTDISEGITGMDADGVGAIIGLPFHFVAMACFAALNLVHDGEEVFAIRFVPILVFLTILVFGFFAGRFIQKRSHEPSLLHIAVSSLIAGFPIAVIGTLMPFIFAIRESDARLDAAGPGGFFGLWFVFSLVLAVGQFSGAQRPRWWAAVRELFAGFRLAFVHALILAVVMVVGFFLYGLFQGVGFTDLLSMVFVLPLLGGAFGGLGVAIASLAGITVSYSGYGASGADVLTLFSTPWYVILLVLLLDVVLLVAMAVLWSRGRRVVPGNMLSIVTSWLALPTAYFLAGIALTAISTLNGGTSLLDGGFGSLGGSLGAPLWAPFLFAIWGFVVELLARFGGPFITPFIPEALTSWIRRSRLSGSHYAPREDALVDSQPLAALQLGMPAAGAGAGAAAGGAGQSAGNGQPAQPVHPGQPMQSAPQQSAPYPPQQSAPHAPQQSAPHAPQQSAQQAPFDQNAYPQSAPQAPGQTGEQQYGSAQPGQPNSAPPAPGYPNSAPQAPGYPNSAPPAPGSTGEQPQQWRPTQDGQQN